MVLSRRLVTISGPPGIGRSSLAAALCHYIDERKSTMMFEHIYFVRYKPKRNGTASPIFSLCDHIKSTRNWGKPISTNLDLDEAIEIILRALRKKKTLLAFERIDALERADAQDFQFFLSQIFAETKDVHVLISSDKSLGLLQLAGVGEGTYKLEPLSFRSTMKLFAFWCPHLQSSRDRKELLDLIAPETDILDEFRSCVDVSGKVKSMLGDGIPARILSAAHQMSIEEFNELKTLRLWEIKH
jgi:nucleoside-triphosphatase THEP1